MANEVQAALWDDVVGDAWADHAATYDEVLFPLGDAAMARLELAPGDRVLDIGCGTGATTVELARRVGTGRVLGVDLSTRMLDAARARAEAAGTTNVEFRAADVQTTDLGRAVFDRAFSRMGVMFFADPVEAFTRVALALRPGGTLAFCCFQDAAANPGVVLPVLAAAEILELPPVAPDLPGPFSLSDRDGTTTILHQAGLVDVSVEAGPDHTELTGVDDLAVAAERMLLQNPLTNPRYTGASASTRAAALAAVATAVEPARRGGTIRLELGTWIVTARAPG